MKTQKKAWNHCCPFHNLRLSHALQNRTDNAEPTPIWI